MGPFRYFFSLSFVTALVTLMLNSLYLHVLEKTKPAPEFLGTHITNLSVTLLLKIIFAMSVAISSGPSILMLSSTSTTSHFMGSLYLSVFILFSFAVLWRLTSIRLQAWRSSDLSNFSCSPSLKSLFAGRSHSFEFAYIQFSHFLQIFTTS